VNRGVEREDITGKVYGYLTVKKIVPEYSEKRSRNIYWAYCNCSNCGNTNFQVNKHNLRTGRTRSCGCSKDGHKKITGSNSVQWTGHNEISGNRWSKIKRNAKKRGIKFNVTIQYVWKLFEKQNRKCKLSGLEITFGKLSNQSFTASLDRIDNTKGYVKCNVHWVHKDINRIKSDLDISYFKTLCKLVVENSCEN